MIKTIGRYARTVENVLLLGPSGGQRYYRACVPPLICQTWSNINADVSGMVHQYIAETGKNGVPLACNQLTNISNMAALIKLIIGSRRHFEATRITGFESFSMESRLTSPTSGMEYTVSFVSRRVEPQGSLWRIEKRSARASYSISCDKTASVVFQNVIKYLLNIDRHLDVLTTFEDRRGRAEDLPTWVPGWRHPTPSKLQYLVSRSKLEHSR